MPRALRAAHDVGAVREVGGVCVSGSRGVDRCKHGSDLYEHVKRIDAFNRRDLDEVELARRDEEGALAAFQRVGPQLEDQRAHLGQRAALLLDTAVDPAWRRPTWM